MRLTATSITILSLLVAGCAVQPPDFKKELNALNGPKPATVGDSLKAQADQAVAAKDYVRAAQTYKQLVDKEPDNREYTLALADSLRRAGDNQGALKVLDPYLAKYDTDAAGFETKGLCMLSMGSFADAGKSFEQVMKVDPTRWRTLNAIGILFTMKGKLTEAVAYYDEALDHSDDNASVLNNKAITLAMDNKYDDAIASFMRTRKNLRAGSPDIQQVDMNLALVYAIAGKLDDAERTATPYLTKPALYNNMGVYAELAKNPDLAKSYLNMALTQSPVYYERAWKNLSTVSDDKESSGTLTGKMVNVAEAETQSAQADKQVAKKEPAKKAKKKEEDGVKLDQIPSPKE